ncbi:putative reverse transcriptase domain-containing protein [Tanacetum coccineum]
MLPRNLRRNLLGIDKWKKRCQAIEKYEKTRADSNNTGGSGSTNTRGTAIQPGATYIIMVPVLKSSQDVKRIGYMEKDCRVRLQVARIDLLPTRLESFDVIIGMDWLAYHQALIDYYEKIVHVPLLNGKILEVQGERPKKEISVACYYLKDRSSPRISSVESPEEDISNTAFMNFRYGQKKEHKSHLKMILDHTLEGEIGQWYFNRDGIHMDPSKVESIKNWKTPESSTEIRLFLGLAGYYRRRTSGRYALSRKERLKPRRVRAMSITIHFRLKTKILEAQSEAFKDLKAPTECLSRLETHFEQRDDGEIYFFYHIWIPSVGGVKKLIMDEAHTYRYSVHPGVDKMYYDLRDLYWWPRLTKSAHFLPIREDLKDKENSKGFIQLDCSETWMCRIEIDENLRFVEEPIEIVERDVKKLKRRRIPLVKVRWNSRQGAEYTWEREDQFQKKYPHLFSEPVPSSSAAT